MKRCESQPFVGGLAGHFVSPTKRRVYKPRELFQQPLDHSIRRQQLAARLQKVRDRMQGPRSDDTTPSDAMELDGGEDGNPSSRETSGDPGMVPGTSPDGSFGAGVHFDDIEGHFQAEYPPIGDPFAAESLDSGSVPEPQTPPPGSPSGSKPKKKKKRDSKATKRAKAQASFQQRWSKLLPSLVGPFLDWIDATTAQNCNKKATSVACLFQNNHTTHSISYCTCESVAAILIRHGLFPCAPSQPKQEIHIPLLDFYQALFERSCDAVNALVSALVTHYTRRGFPVRHSDGKDVKDAFRKGVTAAVSWYDHLQRVIDEAMHAAVLESNPPGESHRDGASQYLQQKCPACFGGHKFGNKKYPFPFISSFNGVSLRHRDSDIHVSVDGNFNHRHLREAGDSPHLHIPEYYVSKQEVDAVGDRIDQARKRKPKARKVVVPDEAVDECEDGHIAGTGTNVKTSGERYDDMGNMALVCRHDIPLLLANIDSPGEQQNNAYVAVFYDIGCVLDRSCQSYDILPTNIMERLTFSTSIMHAYGHQWPCQLVYNPRLRENLGMTDGEGTERFWSRTRKIISVTRTSGRTRRLWLIDRLTARIGAEMRDGLGDWMKRRLKNVEAQETEARTKLNECGVPEEELRQLWDDQRTAQISLRNHAPARLKKDLEKVLAIQADLDRIDETIRSASSILGQGPDVTASLKQLTESHEYLSTKVDDLYLSLNILDSFPSLKDLPFAVVHKLLLARDLKINVRKWAIGSFFEYDKLEQAAGGRAQALGTKLHQATRAAISKRKPAFLSAIRRFNKYCDELKVLIDPKWGIPVPKPLPTTIHQLRETSHLMEDVWIEPSSGAIPRWLESLDVREGIRAMLKLDRCKEERVRLGRESDNMCRWFGREMKNAHIAWANPENRRLRCHLEQYCSRLRQSQHSWANSPFAQKNQYQFHITEAESALRRAGHDLTTTIWVAPVISHNPTLDLDTIEGGYDEADDSSVYTCDSDVDSESEANEELPGLDTDPEAILQEQLAEDEVDGREDEPDPMPITIVWRAPYPLLHDCSLLNDLKHPSLKTITIVHAARKKPTRPHLRSGYIEFCSDSLDRLSRPKDRLNDVNINGLALLLQDIFHNSPAAAQCAIFSTFDVHLARYDQPTAEIWRRTKQTEALLVVVVYPTARRVLFYDSLASGPSDCPEVIQETTILVGKLLRAAMDHGHSDYPPLDYQWVGNPLLEQPVQTTSYSCGLWVLAVVGAILRGYHLPGVCENDLPEFRELLYHWALTLPSIS
ncbi:hypothetical protein MD484_g8939, partial [Candolleomyces efflorescens]